MSTKKSGGKLGGGSNGSAGKSGGGSQGSMGKSAPKPSSQGMSGGRPSSQGMSGGKPSSSVDTKSLRFTQDSIKGSFSKGNLSGVKLQDAVADIKAGKLDPSSNGPLNVHKGQKGELWCENNRSLFVAREAGVPSVEVKVKSSDFKSRTLGDTTREKLGDPNFFPRVRGSGQ